LRRVRPFDAQVKPAARYRASPYKGRNMDWITDLIALGDFEDSRDPNGVDAVLT
jgi:hypothetical protein